MANLNNKTENTDSTKDQKKKGKHQESKKWIKDKLKQMKIQNIKESKQRIKES